VTPRVPLVAASVTMEKSALQIADAVAVIGIAAVVAGRCRIKCEMKAPWMDPGLRELAALSALAALGCGLAAGQGDFLFVVLFGAANVVTIIEAILRLR